MWVNVRVILDTLLNMSELALECRDLTELVVVLSQLLSHLSHRTIRLAMSGFIILLCPIFAVQFVQTSTCDSFIFIVIQLEVIRRSKPDGLSIFLTPITFHTLAAIYPIFGVQVTYHFVRDELAPKTLLYILRISIAQHNETLQI